MTRRQACATATSFGGIWKQAENKSSRPHALALPALALDIVGQGEPKALVFAGGNGKISGLLETQAGARQGVGRRGLAACTIYAARLPRTCRSSVSRPILSAPS